MNSNQNKVMIQVNKNNIIKLKVIKLFKKIKQQIKKKVKINKIQKEIIINKKSFKINKYLIKE